MASLFNALGSLFNATNEASNYLEQSLQGLRIMNGLKAQKRIAKLAAKSSDSERQLAESYGFKFSRVKTKKGVKND